jgi:threonine/homoserine/homoserine lactone efflux protein
MTFEHWLAFAATSALIVAVPGPTVLMIISYALGHGRRSAAAIVAGVALGDFTAMTVSMLGLGTLLAASAMAFTAVKWAGAAYLVYLGIKLWRAPVDTAMDVAAPPEWSRWRIFAHAYVAATLNPKGIVFYVAFFPQFLIAGEPLLGQMAVFEATFVVLATLNALAYALLASAMRQAIRKPSVQRLVNRSSGTLLILAGALTALWRRTPA